VPCSILSVVLSIGGRRLCVAASHLESPSPAPGMIAKMQLSRQAQLEAVRPCSSVTMRLTV
jgi:hypothetical protein